MNVPAQALHLRGRRLPVVDDDVIAPVHHPALPCLVGPAAVAVARSRRPK
jgi:hypothetical protein